MADEKTSEQVVNELCDAQITLNKKIRQAESKGIKVSVQIKLPDTDGNPHTHISVSTTETLSE